MKTKLLFVLIMVTLGIAAFGSDDCETTKSAEQAEETLEIKTDVPKWLEGATITIRQADGKESTVPAEKFKVVPRKQQFIVTKTKQSQVTMCKAEQKKNRISVLGGAGPSGNLKATTLSPSKAQVETGPGAVGGLQYQRKLGETFNAGAQVQTNGTGLLSIGVDF